MLEEALRMRTRYVFLPRDQPREGSGQCNAYPPLKEQLVAEKVLDWDPAEAAANTPDPNTSFKMVDGVVQVFTKGPGGDPVTFKVWAAPGGG
eukprot:8615483-Pyramimonas_sp.AAC.1